MKNTRNTSGIKQLLYTLAGIALAAVVIVFMFKETNNIKDSADKSVNNILKIIENYDDEQVRYDGGEYTGEEVVRSIAELTSKGYVVRVTTKNGGTSKERTYSKNTAIPASGSEYYINPYVTFKGAVSKNGDVYTITFTEQTT